jgi:hypothetical protein
MISFNRDTLAKLFDSQILIRRFCMKRIIALVAAYSLLSYNPASATLYRHITAETVSPYSATINPDGSLTEDGINYPAVFKPVPQATWVRSPWISPSQMFLGYHAIGMEIDPQSPPPAAMWTRSI